MSRLKKEIVIDMYDYLIDLANSGKTKTYSEVTNDLKLGNPQIVGVILSPIQDFCTESNLPSLTALVVNKETGTPGSGFEYRGRDIEIINKAVYDFDWDDIDFIGFITNHPYLTNGKKDF